LVNAALTYPLWQCRILWNTTCSPRAVGDAFPTLTIDIPPASHDRPVFDFGKEFL